MRPAFCMNEERVWPMTGEFKKNQCFPLTITGISNDGNGVGRIDGFTVFVPCTAIGDIIQVRLVKVLKRYAFGRVEQLLAPSPDRCEPGCSSYPRCGGCSLRQMTYESELLVKEQMVRDAFERIGGLSPAFEPILGSEKTERYRNKAQYPLGTDPSGQVIAGFYGRHSHRVIPCPDCALQPEVFSQIVETVRAFIQKNHIPVYNEETGQGLVRNIYLRVAEETGEIMVCLVVKSGNVPGLSELTAELTNKYPAIASIYLNINPHQTNVVLGKEYRLLWGKEKITDRLCGVTLQIAPASFYQVNRRQAQRLYEIAGEYAGLTGKEVLLDLYCGVGSIGLSMASKAARLIGVEIVPEAVENARENAQLAGITNAEFLCGDAKAAAAQLVRQGVFPDVVIVDPPRKGCDRQVLEAIQAMAPSRVVMVSCNPATAARDCGELAALGYLPQKVQAVDMFPRTSHVECAVLLSKGEIDSYQPLLEDIEDN